MNQQHMRMGGQRQSKRKVRDDEEESRQLPPTRTDLKQKNRHHKNHVPPSLQSNKESFSDSVAPLCIRAKSLWHVHQFTDEACNELQYGVRFRAVTGH